MKYICMLLGAVALIAGTAAHAGHGSDVVLGSALGGAVGATVGSAIGGRDAAIVGGAIGAAAGVAAINDCRHHHNFYRDRVIFLSAPYYAVMHSHYVSVDYDRPRHPGRHRGWHKQRWHHHEQD